LELDGTVTALDAKVVVVEGAVVGVGELDPHEAKTSEERAIVRTRVKRIGLDFLGVKGQQTHDLELRL
jgi:hypothetical protein